jgi:stalled ribosome alternative rescue factor ArfA
MKPRNLVAKDMFTNGLYRAKVIKSKKAYQRKLKHKENYEANQRFESSDKNFTA